MTRDPIPTATPTASQLAAVSIDSSAALALCGILLEVLSQMPEAQALLQAALERGETAPQPEDSMTRAAALVAMGLLRDACQEPARRAA